MVGNIPLVTFTISATASALSNKIWSLACVQQNVTVKKPDEPWCAIMLHPTEEIDLCGDLLWLRDFERCMAWAWLKLKENADSISCEFLSHLTSRKNEC